MKFSERIGIVKAKELIQMNSIDGDLKNGLWNALLLNCFKSLAYEIRNSNCSDLIVDIWLNHLKYRIDTLSNYSDDFISVIREKFFSCKWYEIYDLIDFVANSEHFYDKEDFVGYCNTILEKELSGYRFINGALSPITSTTEIMEIDEAIENASENSFSGVKLHLGEALKMLSSRKSPDYRNSIKESISAVESICNFINGTENDTLGKALKKLKEKVEIHSSLEQGFLKIYGYTNDADGIRHAMMEESKCEFEDAKYMLVSCSAFINYLIVKADKSGIK